MSGKQSEPVCRLPCAFSFIPFIPFIPVNFCLSAGKYNGKAIPERFLKARQTPPGHRIERVKSKIALVRDSLYSPSTYKETVNIKTVRIYLSEFSTGGKTNCEKLLNKTEISKDLTGTGLKREVYNDTSFNSSIIFGSISNTKSTSSIVL